MNRPDPLPECKKPELNLVIWPDERLKFPVAPFPEENLNTTLVKNTAGAMIRGMYKHYGVGMAAPQMGVPFQIFVMDAFWTRPDRTRKPRVFLNPKIVGVGDGAIEVPGKGEGCLSFPYDYHNPVRRYDKIELEWLDFKGNTHHEWFEGYAAIIIQHEFDHLLGFCFIDRLSLLKQGIAIRKARKIRRHYRNGMKRGIKQLKNAHREKDYLIARNKDFEKKQKEKKNE